MNKENIFKWISLAIIGLMIAWQTYEIYKIEKALEAAEKSGQLKCSPK